MVGSPNPSARCALLALLWAFSVVLPAFGADLDLLSVPAAHQVEILENVLAFDKARTGPLVVAVVYQPMNRTSALIASAILEAGSQRKTRLSWISYEIDQAADLEELLDAGRVDVLYVAPLQAMDHRDVALIAERHGVLTVTGVTTAAGTVASISISRFRDKPKIIIQLARSRREGSDLSSHLLKIADVRP